MENRNKKRITRFHQPADSDDSMFHKPRGWWAETMRQINAGYKRCAAKYGWKDESGFGHQEFGRKLKTH